MPSASYLQLASRAVCRPPPSPMGATSSASAAPCRLQGQAGGHPLPLLCARRGHLPLWHIVLLSVREDEGVSMLLLSCAGQVLAAVFGAAGIWAGCEMAARASLVGLNDRPCPHPGCYASTGAGMSIRTAGLRSLHCARQQMRRCEGGDYCSTRLTDVRDAFWGRGRSCPGNRLVLQPGRKPSGRGPLLLILASPAAPVASRPSALATHPAAGCGARDAARAAVRLHLHLACGPADAGRRRPPALSGPAGGEAAAAAAAAQRGRLEGTTPVPLFPTKLPTRHDLSHDSLALLSC